MSSIYCMNNAIQNKLDAGSLYCDIPQLFANAWRVFLFAFTVLNVGSARDLTEFN